MPTPRGVVRRPNAGKGATTSTSVSFAKDDYLWLNEQSTARSVSLSLVIAEAVALYRANVDGELSDIEREDRARARTKQPDAPQESVAL